MSENVSSIQTHTQEFIMAVTQALSLNTQVNVGAIVAGAFDAAIKKALLDLATAATSQEPAHLHPMIASLGADVQQGIQSISSDDLLQFIGNQAGCVYSIDFLPAVPRPQVPLQFETTKIRLDVEKPAEGAESIFSAELFIGGEVTCDVRGSTRGDIDIRCGGTIRF